MKSLLHLLHSLQTLRVNLLSVCYVVEIITLTEPPCMIGALLAIDLQLACHHTKHMSHACFVHNRSFSGLQEYQTFANTWLNNNDACSEYTQGIKRKALCPQ